jgi:hypothetical protein
MKFGRSIGIALAVVVFAWFVWPTPFAYYMTQGNQPAFYRINRINRSVEVWAESSGTWQRNALPTP